jgi:hypothetical protein
MRAIGIEKTKAAELKTEALRRAGVGSICLAAVLACGTMPVWALGVSVGGVSASVDVGGGGLDVDVDVGVGGVSVDADVGVGTGGVDADVDVAVGSGGGGGGGGTGGGVMPGDDVVVDDDDAANARRVTVATKTMVCAQDGNATAFNGFPVRDRDGDVVGWVHDATITPDNKLLAVRLQSTGKACYKLSGAGFKVGNGEVWTNVDGDKFR